MKYPGTELDWFVVGFPFTEGEEDVLLIEKQKKWCKGLWNGVGGGVELEDHFHGQPQVNKVSSQAMVREFREETGLATKPSDWECYCVLEEPRAMVFFFRMFSTKTFLGNAKQTTVERIRFHASDLSLTIHGQLMPNLGWLIAMAMNRTVILARVDQQGGQYDGVR